MPLIKKSRNAVWRVWSGPYSVGGKNAKKRVGVTVSVTIRSDKMPPNFSESEFVEQGSGAANEPRIPARSSTVKRFNG